MKIALTGNPNSGKTTMYNALTGKNEHAGNWAGVSVDKKESIIKKKFTGGDEITAVDLPGAYSMSPFTSEESITTDFIHDEKPDVIINIVDATNLSRSLFFTTQLLELGIPVVVAVNKADLLEKQSAEIDLDLLSSSLLCPVVSTISTNASGLLKVVTTAVEIAGNQQITPFSQAEINLNNKDEVVASDKKRFAFVNSIVEKTQTRKVLTSEKTAQDKLDSVIAHKWLGIPIFAIVMWAVFSISQTHLGPFISEY